MFTVKANPKFDATLTIVGQGREQTLAVTFNHRPVKDWDASLEKVRTGEIQPAELILDIIDAWDADVALDQAGVDLLLDEQPGIQWAIFVGYRDALSVARKGN